MGGLGKTKGIPSPSTKVPTPFGSVKLPSPWQPEDLAICLLLRFAQHSVETEMILGLFRTAGECGVLDKLVWEWYLLCSVCCSCGF